MLKAPPIGAQTCFEVLTLLKRSWGFDRLLVPVGDQAAPFAQAWCSRTKGAYFEALWKFPGSPWEPALTQSGLTIDLAFLVYHPSQPTYPDHTQLEQIFNSDQLYKLHLLRN